MTFSEAQEFAAPTTRCCLLCAKPAMWRAVFIPSEPRLWGGPPLRPGKTRGLFYGLCRKCMRRPDRVSAVEAAILARSVAEETRQ